MDDLHRALVLKVYFTVCEADRKWTEAERYMAEVLSSSIFGESVSPATSCAKRQAKHRKTSPS